MKKVVIFAIAGTLLVSSCGTYTGEGAYTGSTLGSILGSVIGGLSDGPRGSDIGSLIGMAGGAVVGAAIGNAADKAQQERVARKRDEIRERNAQREYENSQYEYQGQIYEGSGYDPNNGGDDRIDLNIGNVPNTANYPDGVSARPGGTNVRPVSPVPSRTAAPALEVRNVRFLDESHDNALGAGEMGRVVFEVVNRSSQTLYDIRPTVVEVSGNRQVYISPEARVEQLGPGKGIRYTAMVRGGNRLKNGSAVFQVRAFLGNGRNVSNAQELRIQTVRR
jgi:hypothetical protein